MESFFPKAVLFKERRQNRMLFTLLWLLAWSEPLLVWVFVGLKSPSDGWSDIQDVLRTWMQDLFLNDMGVNSSIGAITSVVVVIIGVRIWTTEFRSGTLLFGLAGPSSRRTFVRVKSLLGVVHLGAIYGLLGLYLSVVDLACRLDVSFVQIWITMGSLYCIQCLFYFVGMFMTMFVTNELIAAGMAIAICAGPVLLSGFLKKALDPGYQHVHFDSWMSEMKLLSPFSPYGSHNISGLQIIWYVLAAAGVLGLLQWRFQKAEAERFAEFWILRGAWRLFAVPFCMLGGAVMSLIWTAMMFMNSPPRPLFPFFLVFTVLLYGITLAVGRTWANTVRRRRAKTQFGSL